MKSKGTVVAGLFVALFASNVRSQEVSLSPQIWGENEVKTYRQLMRSMPTPNPLVQGKQGAITGTYSAIAMRAGFEALQQGGTAVDAVLTTANTQIAVCGGCWVSYTGILSMVYYDASTGQIHNLNAGYNTVLGEDDPISIPGNPNLMNDIYGGTPSGRATLVPGYMAGVEAAHKRFGKLPFHCLFEPAIFFAENGVEITPYFAEFMDKRKDVLTRLPEIRSIFCDQDGEPLKSGDTLRQPALATTLKQISEHGADYMYRGPWANKFAKAVQAEGGKITVEDLKKYRAQWTQPARGKYREYQIVSHGLPAIGGLNIIEVARLYELSGLKKKGHYSRDSESLFWLAQFHRLMSLAFLPPDMTDGMGKAIGADLSPVSRLAPATTEKIWSAMQAGKFPLAQAPTQIEQKSAGSTKHSDAIVAVDQYGNVCAIVHSINTVMWGKTGIFVDGISVNDSASFQQSQIAQLEPGSRLPDPTNPTIVLNQEGKPILTCSSMGSGLHQKTSQCLISVLDFGMDPKQADESPYLMTPSYSGLEVTQRVIKGKFDSEVLDGARKMGLDIEELDKNSRFAQGLWIGITLNPETGDLKTASPAVTNGAAFAR